MPFLYTAEEIKQISSTMNYKLFNMNGNIL